MKKKVVKSISLILGIVLILALSLGIYFPVSSNSKEKELKEYLIGKGYCDADILDVDIENNVLYHFSDYPRWWAVVEFSDEPGVTYQYCFGKDGEISQGTVNGGEALYGLADKDELYNMLKHLE